MSRRGAFAVVFMEAIAGAVSSPTTTTPDEPIQDPPTTARDEDAPVSVPYVDPPPSNFSGVAMGSLRHTRSGLLLRPTLGLGVTHIFRRTEQSSTDGTGPTSGSSAITAVPLEFRGLIGGALSRDVVLGGFLGIAQSPGATFASTGDDSLSFEEGIALQMVGAQLLFFVDSASPWQLGASVAFLNWSAHEPGSDGKVPGGAGILGTLEAGYHLWVGPRFELGLVFDLDLGATQNGQVFRISEVLVQNSETSFLIRGSLAIALSYY